jgi:hypothetical protein
MRVQYPGAIYHVMSRGDRREDIYLDDVDRQDFLKTLVDGMSWLLSTYTIRLNRRHKMSGHIFSGRYKSPLVDGSGSR